MREVDHVMAISQGCWKVAYKRFIDYVVMLVDDILMQSFAKDAFLRVWDQVIARKCSEELLQLVEEERHTAERRKMLRTTIERQELGLELLQPYIN